LIKVVEGEHGTHALLRSFVGSNPHLFESVDPIDLSVFLNMGMVENNSEGERIYNAFTAFRYGAADNKSPQKNRGDIDE
jgi:hypothetical protein